MLTAHFDMKYLSITFFVLGIEIYRDRTREILGLSQKGYIERVLDRFNMKSCKPCTTHIQKGEKFSKSQCSKDDGETTKIEKVPFASTVGSLMNAQVCTRPNITFIVNVLGRYLSNLGLPHWQAAKRVMRYLQGTKDYMLTFRRSDCLELTIYFDSNYCGCLDDFKFTSGCIFYVG